MSALNVLAMLERQERDRADRAKRYRLNAAKAARRKGEPQVTADRMASYADYMATEMGLARVAINNLVAAHKALIEHVEVPDKDCSCCVSPPCNDCVEWSGLREALQESRAALEHFGGAS